jgi:hypothetical protein
MSEEGFDLFRIRIPPEAIQMLPAHVARELSVVPVEVSDCGVVVAMATVIEETVDKLAFIWNRRVSVVYASGEAIEFALASTIQSKDITDISFRGRPGGGE